jgi:hypothetical protein
LACTPGRAAQAGPDAAPADGGGETGAVGRALELEHRWRQLGNEADGREALARYRAAARETRDPGACDAALRGAHHAGDLSHDAEAAYEELYRARRRFEARDPACARNLEDALSLLAAFRPSQAVLDAIEIGLAAEGVASPGAPGDTAAPARAPVAGPRPPQVSGIEAWPSPDAARIVVVLDRSAAYRVADDVNPSGAVRTVLDLDGVDLGGAPRELPAGGIVTRARA